VLICILPVLFTCQSSSIICKPYGSSPLLATFSQSVQKASMSLQNTVTPHKLHPYPFYLPASEHLGPLHAFSQFPTNRRCKKSTDLIKVVPCLSLRVCSSIKGNFVAWRNRYINHRILFSALWAHVYSWCSFEYANNLRGFFQSHGEKYNPKHRLNAETKPR
jgi:hypothetical protein